METITTKNKINKLQVKTINVLLKSHMIIKRHKMFLATIIFSLSFLSIMAEGADDKKPPKSGLYDLCGSAYDSFLHIPLETKVFLLDKDSVILDTTTCDINEKYSSYEFKVPKKENQYIIKCVRKGYEDCYQSVSIKPRGRSYYTLVPQHLMKKKKDIYKNVDLDEVKVVGTRIQVAYRGDTLVYDASAFVLPEGSMLDVLVRKLPGAQLKDNGDIYINGQKVDYLTLNGNDFFKGKNKIILDNLPYFTVKDIKVYHKEKNLAEQYTTMGPKKDFVMDVNLKREYRHSHLANAEFGAGSDNRWKSQLFSLIMTDHSNIAVFGNANNVNEDRKPGQDGDWKPSDTSRGTKTTRQTGFYLQTEDKKKTLSEELDGLVEWNDNNQDSHTHSETFSSDGNIIKGNSSIDKNKEFHVSLNNTFQLFEPFVMSCFYSLDYGKTKSYSENRDSTYRAYLINHTEKYAKSLIDNIDTRIHLSMFKELPWGDTLGLSFNGNYLSNKPDELYSKNHTVYEHPANKDIRDYYTDNNHHGYEYQASLNYTFSLPQNWKIMPFWGYGQSFSSQQNANYRLDWLKDSTYDELGDLPSNEILQAQAFDSNNSYQYNDINKKYMSGISFYTGTKNSFFSINFPFNVYRERIHYRQSTLDTIARRSNFSFQPNITYNTYGPDKRSFSYSMNVEEPNFSMLMPFADNTNPLSLRINNPSLKKRIIHKLSANATFHPDSTDMSYWIGLDARYVHNAWGTRVTYNTNTGAFTYMSDNVDGNWDASLKGGFFRSLDNKRRFSLNVDANADYDHSADYDIAYNSEPSVISHVNTLKTGLNVKLKYRLRNFSAGITTKFMGRFSRSNHLDFEKINAYDYQYGGNLQYTIPLVNLTLATDMNMYSRRGYNSQQMNTDDLIWNVQLTRPLSKGNILLKLQAFDILHQLSNKSYTVNAQGRTEVWYNSLPRYLMFSVAFKFNQKMKNK